jgi:hypothetical protein
MRFDEARAGRVSDALAATADDRAGDDLLERVAAELGKVVPFDGGFIAAADPATMLCMRRGLVHNLDPTLCQAWWDNEYLMPDLNKYAEVARSAAPAVTLDRATGARPHRSERYQCILRPMGYRAELRFACSTDGTWGFGCLVRDRHRPEFGDDEVAFVGAVTATIGSALKRSLAATVASGDEPSAEAAVVVFDDADHPVSATTTGMTLLADVIGDDDPGQTPVPFAAARRLQLGDTDRSDHPSARPVGRRPVARRRPRAVATRARSRCARRPRPHHRRDRIVALHLAAHRP